jgi:hypothetical protein
MFVGAGDKYLRILSNILQKIELKLYVKFKPYSRVWRWDDLLILVGTPLEKDAFKLISKALMKKMVLC